MFLHNFWMYPCINWKMGVCPQHIAYYNFSSNINLWLNVIWLDFNYLFLTQFRRSYSNLYPALESFAILKSSQIDFRLCFWGCLSTYVTFIVIISPYLTNKPSFIFSINKLPTLFTFFFIHFPLLEITYMLLLCFLL